MYKINKNFDIELFKKNIYNKKNKKESYKSLLDMNIGVYIITPIFLGLIIGIYLDNYFDKKPFFIVLFILLGCISSFYNLYKLIKTNK